MNPTSACQCLHKEASFYRVAETLWDELHMFMSDSIKSASVASMFRRVSFELNRVARIYTNPAGSFPAVQHRRGFPLLQIAHQVMCRAHVAVCRRQEFGDQA